jgi:hypothetical protein
MKTAVIKATDAVLTGSEPTWANWEMWPVENFFKEYGRAFRFYSYYCSGKDLNADIGLWMSQNGYSKADSARIAKSNDKHVPGLVAGTIARCINRGMPMIHPKADEWQSSVSGKEAEYVSPKAFLVERISLALNQVEVKSKTASTKVRVNPLDRLREKTQKTIIAKLDGMIDTMAVVGDISNLMEFDIYKEMGNLDLPAKAVPFVKEWLQQHLDWYLDAYNKTCPQMVEAYRYLSRSHLKQRVKFYTMLIEDLGKFKAAKKAKVKVPKVKKLPSEEKQLARLKYARESTEHKVVSIDPRKVIGAQRALTFNTKTRMFGQYVANSTSGFIFKGTSLHNIDADASVQTRLRKPEVFLPIATSGTTKQFEKAFKELTTVKSKAKGRINEDTILIRAFN